MSVYEVETDLIIHTKVKVIVEAGGIVEAINAVADLLPANHDMARAKAWKATVLLKPPKGVTIEVVRAYHFEQASGADRAKLLNRKTS